MNRGFEDEEAQHAGNGVQFAPMSEKRLIDEPRKLAAETALGKRLGVDELFCLKLWRAAFGELIGTAALVFMLDTIVISIVQTEAEHATLLMSILIAVAVALLVLCTMPISGGHLSPVVSLSAALIGLISLTRAVVYTAVQCLGATLGALAVKAVISSATEDLFSLCGCTVTVLVPTPAGNIAVGLETGRALWLEIICTFLFLVASIWTAFDLRRDKRLSPLILCSIIGLVVGLLLFVSTTLTGKRGYSGVGMNPARCIGPALVRGGHLWSGHWVFWVGPGIAITAFYLYMKIIPKEHFHAAEYKYAIL
uniref:Uncharacterized protein n=2 Tax=Kalanchoe fedtschenkoi TaxID=63787 RepID=A0A7N0U5U0_KALFE